MKNLKKIMLIGLSLAVIAVLAAAYNLMRLYEHEKAKTMETVKTCAENADILEIVSRMESSNKANQAFVRLNAFMEMTQLRGGMFSPPDSSDTIRTSLASLLRFGLEFPEDKALTDYEALDSFFRAELYRHGLFPRIAEIEPEGKSIEKRMSLWKTQFRVSPHEKTPTYDVYVSPMPGKVLSGMWGIIIPFVLVICIFLYLSIYLLGIIRRLRTLDQMKDDFTHNMTHELKTPVAVAYSAADSMLRYYDQSDEARNRKFLNIILQRLSHLSGMIENILSMSMERFNNMQLNLENINVKSTVEEIACMIELKSDKPVSIEIDIPEDLTLHADTLHFGNMISNLLENAIKYSGDSVLIRVTADSCSIVVSDNGIGISKEDLPFIFDKFYRVSSGDRYEVGGYGLGLYYVKQIVALHVWSIKAESQLNRGSIFTIQFKSNE